VALAALAVASVLVIIDLRRDGRRWDGNLTVGIGFFEGEEGDPLHLERAIFDRISTRLREYESVAVVPLVAVPKKYESREDALRRIARWQGVELLVWGWYAVPEDTGTVTVNFEVTQRGFGLRNQQQQEILPAKDFQRFAVHGRLALEVEYITLVILGIAEFINNKTQTALALLDKAIALPVSPDSVLPPSAVYQLRGLLNTLAFDMPAAARDYRQAIELGYRDPGVYFDLAAAMAYYASPEETLAVMDTAVQLFPDFQSDKGYLTNRIGVFVKGGMLDSALVNCERLEALRGSEARTDSLLFNGLINCGLAYKGSGQIGRAVSVFRRARRIDPTHSLGNQYLGESLTALGDSARRAQAITRAVEYYREGARYLSHAVRIRPSRPDIRIARYEALRKLASASSTSRGVSPDTALLRRALRDLEEVDKINAHAPDGSFQAFLHPSTYGFIIDTYLSLEDARGALRMLDNKLELFGEGDTIMDVPGLLMQIAFSAQQFGDRSTAEVAINRAVMWYPNDPGILSARSIFHERNGDLFSAIQDIENALILECGPIFTRILFGHERAPRSLSVFGVYREEALRWEGLVGNYMALQEGRIRCGPSDSTPPR
jgi:tetratricopeptide (TPR) repeat protein